MRGLAQLRAALQAAARGPGSSSGGLGAAWQQLQRAGIVAAACSGAWGQPPTHWARGAELQQRRHLAQAPQDSPSSAATAAELSEGYFHKIVDHTLEDLLERLEAFVEELDLDDGDVEYSQGVLTVRLGELGTYVINKQTPNRQIWMSSPVSGPVRYDWAPGKWVYHRDGHDLHARLSAELLGLTGEELDLSPCFACGKLNTCQGEQCDKGVAAT